MFIVFCLHLILRLFFFNLRTVLYNSISHGAFISYLRHQQMKHESTLQKGLFVEGVGVLVLVYLIFSRDVIMYNVIPSWVCIVLFVCGSYSFQKCKSNRKSNLTLWCWSVWATAEWSFAAALTADVWCEPACWWVRVWPETFSSSAAS